MPPIFGFVNDFYIYLINAPFRIPFRYRPSESGTQTKGIYEYVPLEDAGPYEHGESHVIL